VFLGRLLNRISIKYKAGDLPKRLYALCQQFGLPNVAIWHVYCRVSESIIPEAVCFNYKTGDLLRGVGGLKNPLGETEGCGGPEILSQENTENKKYCT
jgi:hypothetical protein